MLFGLLIGINKGIGCEVFLKLIINEIKIFVIIDVGIGRLFYVVKVMEMGVDVVFINIVIVIFLDLVKMVLVFFKVVEVGRFVFEVGFLKEYEYV